MATGWDGRGKPPSVASRLATPPFPLSHLDVLDSVRLEAVGFHPVGEAVGLVVQALTWPGPGACRPWGLSGPANETVTSGQHQRFAGYGTVVDALYRGYETALARLTAEAVSLGAAGVVGVRLDHDEWEYGRRFRAVGTAVRATEVGPTQTPFVTDLDAAAVASLLAGGWVPVSMVIGLSVSVRHEDPDTARQRRRRNRTNGEIDAATDLVERARQDARAQFTQRLQASGATHAIVSSLTLDARDVGTAHRDMVAECHVLGTGIVQFASPRASSTLVLPVRP